VTGLALHWVISAVSGFATIAVAVLIRNATRKVDEEEEAEEGKFAVRLLYPGA